MLHSILNWLDEVSVERSEKICYRDDKSVLTFGELDRRARVIGAYVANQVAASQPVAVMAGRNVYTPAIFLGIARVGCFYVPMNGEMPEQRLRQIMNLCLPEVLIVDSEHMEKAKSIIPDDESCEIILIDSIIETAEKRSANAIDETKLNERRLGITDDTALYCIFTSGSSGVPKGVLTSHGAVWCYLDGLNQVIEIDDTDVIGGQAPLDYIAAIRDMYLPLMTACETVFIPKNTFAMPDELFGFLNNNKVTTICWSATGVEIPARLGAFDMLKPKYLKRVVFSGSVISSKLLSIWQEHLPDTLFVNQYGPTEATGSCTYYVIDEKVDEDTVLPIGKPFDHYEVFLLDEEDEVITPDKCAANPLLSGEIAVSGPALALAYYRAEELSEKSFPILEIEGESKRIYRTGDLGRYDENGELMFLGRRDRQIKHMGHRVELEEIEQIAARIEGVSDSAALYDESAKLIYLFYTGDASAKDITIYFRANVPAFMVPRKLVSLDEMPRLPNGKIDMPALKEMI